MTPEEELAEVARAEAMRQRARVADIEERRRDDAVRGFTAMTVRITTTTGVGSGEPEVGVSTFRDEDLPSWVGHQFEAGASLITLTFDGEDRLVQYERI